jgi:uncharacterized membrane protein
MQTLLERAKSIGRKIGINDDSGVGLAIFLVLIIASAAAIGYFAYAAAYGKGPAPYNTMYLLDNNKKAVDYNETLIFNQNTTFTVGLYVENHLGGNGNQSYQVRVKVTPNLSSIPVNATAVQTYEIRLKNDDTWQTQASVTENQVGSYFVVFELYHLDQNYGYIFTNDYCVLNMQVKN